MLCSFGGRLATGTCGQHGPPSHLFTKPHQRIKLLAQRPFAKSTPDPVAGDAKEPQPASGEPVQGKRRARASRSGRKGASSKANEAPVVGIDVLLRIQVVKKDDDGDPYIDMGCIGSGKQHWYALAILEGKEEKYCELLEDVLSGLGFSVCPERYSALSARGEEGGEAQFADGYDALVWVPSKEMMVYRPNTDKLAMRPVLFNQGGWVLLRVLMDNQLENTLKAVPYFMGWRFSHEVTGTLLANTGLLPPGESPGQVWELPSPVPPDFLARIMSWEVDTSETEDLEARRVEVYGVGGGNPFGLNELRDQDKGSMDMDEQGRKIYRNKAYSGGYNNPSNWDQPADQRVGAGGRRQGSRGGPRGGSQGQAAGSARGDAGRRVRQQQQQEAIPPDGFDWGESGVGDFSFTVNSGSGPGDAEGWDGSWGSSHSNGLAEEATAGPAGPSQEQREQRAPVPSSRRGVQEQRRRSEEVGEAQAQDQMNWQREFGTARYQDPRYQQGPGAAGRTGVRGRTPVGKGLYTGDAAAEIQMDWQYSMGTARYQRSLDEGSDGRAGVPGGRMGGRIGQERAAEVQMGWQAEMGSDRYQESLDDWSGAAGWLSSHEDEGQEEDGAHMDSSKH